MLELIAIGMEQLSGCCKNFPPIRCFCCSRFNIIDPINKDIQDFKLFLVENNGKIENIYNYPWEGFHTPESPIYELNTFVVPSS